MNTVIVSYMFLTFYLKLKCLLDFFLKSTVEFFNTKVLADNVGISSIVYLVGSALYFCLRDPFFPKGIEMF